MKNGGGGGGAGGKDDGPQPPPPAQQTLLPWTPTQRGEDASPQPLPVRHHVCSRHYLCLVRPGLDIIHKNKICGRFKDI